MLQFRYTIRLIGVVFISVAVAACQSTTPTYHATPDLTEKTMTVPRGNKGIIGLTKQMFREHGWALNEDDGPQMLVGAFGQSSSADESRTYSARFKMIATQHAYDYCLPSGRAWSYNISIIDNQTETEVFTLEGRECEVSARNQLEETLAPFWESTEQ